MVASISIYTLFNCVELIVFMIFVFFCLMRKDKKLSEVVIVSCLLLFIVISSFKIPMAILLDKSYWGLIYKIIACSISILLLSIKNNL